MARSIIAVSPRHPYETYTMAWTFLAGLALLIGGPRPGSVSASMGPIEQKIWAGTIVFGAALTLISIKWPNKGTGLLIEQVGLVAAGGAIILYCLSAVWHMGPGAILPLGIIFGFGLACFRRAWEIQRQVLRAQREINGGKRE